MCVYIYVYIHERPTRTFPDARINTRVQHSHAHTQKFNTQKHFCRICMYIYKTPCTLRYNRNLNKIHAKNVIFSSNKRYTSRNYPIKRVGSSLY